MKHQEVIVYTDGGARGNPGPAGLGFVIEDISGNTIYEAGEYIGETTNNVAEYSALIKALQQAKKLEAKIVHVRMDSQLIVRQMNKQYKIKHPNLQPLAAQVFSLINEFEFIDFNHVRREFNTKADNQVNQAIDSRSVV